MQQETLDGHGERPVVIDMCVPCQSFWFDTRESISLTPASTLTLFRLIGEHTGRPQPTEAELAKCPRCRGRLRLTRDIQRNTRFAYLNCPNGHGRLTTFFEFLKEKDFIRPLTPKQIAELRASVQIVNCSNCGAPIELAGGSSCRHCGSPVSMLDMKQAGALVDQLRRADRSSQPVDPALPLELERARREVDAVFRDIETSLWLQEASPSGLVGASLQALARWLKSAR